MDLDGGFQHAPWSAKNSDCLRWVDPLGLRASMSFFYWFMKRRGRPHWRTILDYIIMTNDTYNNIVYIYMYYKQYYIYIYIIYIYIIYIYIIYIYIIYIYTIPNETWLTPPMFLNRTTIGERGDAFYHVKWWPGAGQQCFVTLLCNESCRVGWLYVRIMIYNTTTYINENHPTFIISYIYIYILLVGFSWIFHSKPSSCWGLGANRQAKAAPYTAAGATWWIPRWTFQILWREWCLTKIFFGQLENPFLRTRPCSRILSLRVSCFHPWMYCKWMNKGFWPHVILFIELLPTFCWEMQSSNAQLTPVLTRLGHTTRFFTGDYDYRRPSAISNPWAGTSHWATSLRGLEWWLSTATAAPSSALGPFLV